MACTDGKGNDAVLMCLRGVKQEVFSVETSTSKT
jgi:hypothetical protein